MTIEWSDELSMSNAKIDADHQRLIELVNMLQAEVVSQQRSQEGLARITGLILETKIPHNAIEEEILIEKHVITKAHELHQHHLQLTDEVKQLLEEIQKSPNVHVWAASGLKVVSLLTYHIMNIDTKYREYFRTEG